MLHCAQVDTYFMNTVKCYSHTGDKKKCYFLHLTVDNMFVRDLITGTLFAKILSLPLASAHYGTNITAVSELNI